jgi:hypothetical protein
MATKISKVKISSYKRLKAKKEELEYFIYVIMNRPQSSEAKGLRQQYKIDNDLL